MSKCRVFILTLALLLMLGCFNQASLVIGNFFFKKNIYICHPIIKNV